MSLAFPYAQIGYHCELNGVLCAVVYKGLEREGGIDKKNPEQNKAVENVSMSAGGDTGWRDTLKAPKSYARNAHKCRRFFVPFVHEPSHCRIRRR